MAADDITRWVNLGGWAFCAMAFFAAAKWVVAHIVEPMLAAHKSFLAEMHTLLRRMADYQQSQAAALAALQASIGAQMTTLTRIEAASSEIRERVDEVHEGVMAIDRRSPGGD